MLMLYLHKILPVFLLPTGMTLLVVSLGLLLRKKVLCWAGLVVLWLASTALVGDMAMRAAEGWQVRVPIAALPSSQAIVVLSGMLVEPPGDASLSEWSDAVDRFEAGIALFQAGKAPVLVFTGSWAPWYPGVRPEGEVLAERAALRGVPRRHILVTNQVTNTAEEARAVAWQLRDRLSTTANAQIILVTSAFHMRRSHLLFARAGFQVVPFPVDFRVPAGRAFTILDLLPEADRLSKTELALREWYGFLYYQVVGW
jgi:uncharacterized SAM-binding protein YcdF (DUF218 family)